MKNTDGRMGQFEALVRDIEGQIANAGGGWWINEATEYRPAELVIEQQTSRDPSRSNNGGEYYLWRRYRPDGLGVEIVEDWSCDIAPRNQYGGDEEYYDCIIGIDGLKRVAQLADVTIAAKAWLAKEPGCMKRLKSAIRAMGE